MTHSRCLSLSFSCYSSRFILIVCLLNLLFQALPAEVRNYIAPFTDSDQCLVFLSCFQRRGLVINIFVYNPGRFLHGCYNVVRLAAIAMPQTKCLGCCHFRRCVHLTAHDEGIDIWVAVRNVICIGNCCRLQILCGAAGCAGGGKALLRKGLRDAPHQNGYGTVPAVNNPSERLNSAY